MSKILFMGVKPGYGPVLKIMADESYDPLTTPNTDHHKFRFNSEVEDIGYTFGRSSDFVLTPEHIWDDFNSGNSVAITHHPRGTNDSTCLRQLQVFYNTAGSPRRRVVNYRVALDRGEYASLGYRPIFVRSRDRSDWVSNWVCSRVLYLGNQYRYLSYYKNIMDVTDLTAYNDTSVSDMGLMPRHPNPAVSYPDSAIFQNPAWFGPGPVDLPFPEIGLFDARSELPATGNDNIIITELPLDNEPYPAVSPTFTADQPCLHLSPTIARMAKPGFDVDTAEYDELIFSESKFPLKCVKAGSFTLAASATTNIDIEYPITTRAWVEDQINITGQDLRLPPYPNNNTAAITVEHRIVGQQLQYRNQSSVSVDVRFFVMSGGDGEPSSGTAPVLEAEDGVVTIRRPGTAGTSEADIILDSRATTLPMVAQGWVTGSQLTANASDVARYGTRMHTVNFSNPGSAFKPLVIAMAKYWRGAGHIWQSFFSKNIEWYNFMSASTFMATVTDTQVKFYFYPGIFAGTGTRYEDIVNLGGSNWFDWPEQMELVGFRYYIFAVPATV